MSIKIKYINKINDFITVTIQHNVHSELHRLDPPVSFYTSTFICSSLYTHFRLSLAHALSKNAIAFFPRMTLISFLSACMLSFLNAFSKDIIYYTIIYEGRGKCITARFFDIWIMHTQSNHLIVSTVSEIVTDNFFFRFVFMYVIVIYPY